jgi:hypothetical protein
VSADIASRVTQAARAAQGRIKALAGLTAYGGGYNDAGSLANQAIATGNQAIDMTGNIRKGITQTLGVAQNVQPVQYAAGTDIAGSIASKLAEVAGSAFGAKLSGKA